MRNVQQLVERCQQGDLEAFAILFRRLENRLFDLAFAILQNRDEANDAVQDTFLRVFQRIQSYRGESAFETWVTSIAINQCRNRLRRRKIRQLIPLEHLTQGWLFRKSPPDKLATEYDKKQQCQSLWDLVGKLDERLRLPIILRYRYDYSCQEIGNMLGLKKGTIYQQLHEGRQRLRQEFEQQQNNQTSLWNKLGKKHV